MMPEKTSERRRHLLELEVQDQEDQEQRQRQDDRQRLLGADLVLVAAGER